MPKSDTSTNSSTLTPIKQKVQSVIDYFKSNVDYKSNFLLALGKSLLVFPTQPLQVLMRHQQGSLASDPPRILSIQESYNEIRFKQPMQALFKGVRLSAAKELAKNGIYKATLISGAPDLAESILPERPKNYATEAQYNLVKCLVAGFIASVSDAILGGSIDRIATFQATSQGKKADANFSQELKQVNSVFGKVGFLYKGFAANSIKGSFAFTTMFYVSAPITHWSASIYKHSLEEKAPWYSSATSAILAGIAVAIVSSPWDIVKTQAQMPGSKDKGTCRALYDNYSRHGLRGVTAGLPAKTAMITIGWSLNSLFMQKTKEYRELQKNENHSSQLGR